MNSAADGVVASFSEATSNYAVDSWDLDGEVRVLVQASAGSACLALWTLSVAKDGLAVRWGWAETRREARLDLTWEQALELAPLHEVRTGEYVEFDLVGGCAPTIVADVLGAGVELRNPVAASRLNARAKRRSAWNRVLREVGYSDDVHFAVSDLGPEGEAVSAAIAAALKPVAALFDPKIVDLAGREHWSVRSHRFYAESGDIGERRRKAARSHPAFAPLFAHVPVLAEEIDAGRPLAQVLARTLTSLRRDVGVDCAAGDDGGVVAPAHVAGLVALPADLPCRGIGICIDACAGSGKIPSTAAGWRRLVREAGVQGVVLGEQSVPSDGSLARRAYRLISQARLVVLGRVRFPVPFRRSRRSG